MSADFLEGLYCYIWDKNIYKSKILWTKPKYICNCKQKSQHMVPIQTSKKSGDHSTYLVLYLDTCSEVEEVDLNLKGGSTLPL